MCHERAKRFGWRPLFSTITGALLITLLCSPVFAQPANDDCTNAALIPGDAPDPDFSGSVDATDATLDPADPLLSCNADGDDDGNQTVWWVYTPDDSGLVNFNTAGSLEINGTDDLDTAIGFYTGTCGDLVEVGCADTGIIDYTNFEVTSGTTYYIKVGQFDGGNQAGTVVMNVEAPIVADTLVLESVRNGVSEPVRDIVLSRLAARPLENARTKSALDLLREVPNIAMADHMDLARGVDGSEVDSRAPRGPGIRVELMQMFEGVENDDNWDALGTLIAPPDTIGDVGPHHYVQMVNLLTQIFDKSGNSVLGPFPTSAFFAGLGGNCEISDDGDPIVLYDEEMDRWLVSQFLASFQDGLCIAVSTTGDPTGSYYQYEFDFTGIGFPDYPKYGFATGAVNVMVNLFSPFQGSALGAIDRSEMFAGDPATMVLFTGGLNFDLLFGWIPGDNDGPVFDNTLPTFFLGPPFLSDILVVAELTPDWTTPEDSDLGFSLIPVTPFDSTLCGASRGACIDQPGSGTIDGAVPGLPEAFQVITFLEGITDRMMHRGQTRDFGSRKKAVLSHTVDVDGSGRAGIRWYELWNDLDGGWTLKKENTYSARDRDGDHRWMGSIAMTASGRTCLGYSISSAVTHPSIGLTGRMGTAGLMNARELLAFAGENVQRLTARWGDYSSMSIDPVDDTCWYTQEYAKPNDTDIGFGVPLGEVFGWGTKVMQYHFPGRGVRGQGQATINRGGKR